MLFLKTKLQSMCFRLQSKHSFFPLSQIELLVLQRLAAVCFLPLFFGKTVVHVPPAFMCQGPMPLFIACSNIFSNSSYWSKYTYLCTWIPYPIQKCSKSYGGLVTLANLAGSACLIWSAAPGDTAPDFEILSCIYDACSKYELVVERENWCDGL